MNKFEINDLKSQNLWWEEKTNVLQDRHIRQFNEQKIKWHPNIISEFKFNNYYLYSLRGPRQVGKTTTLKLIIKEKLLKEKIQPVRIFYYNCDNLEGRKDLENIISTYINWASKFTKERLLIFLDEITEIADWQKTLKYLSDLGSLQNTVIMVTGSNAYDLKYAAERLPGRRGMEIAEKLDKILYPLSFREYIKIIDKDLEKKIESLNLSLENLIERKKIENLSKFTFYQKDLDFHLEQYLLCGGFITAINSLHNKNTISPVIYDLYLEWIKGDFKSFKKSEQIFKTLTRDLVRTFTTQIGWNTIAGNLGDVSNVTISEYAEILELIFLIYILYQIDLKTKKEAFRKLKKIYFFDPFIFHSLRGWILGEGNFFNGSKKWLESSENKSKLIENIVIMHLKRLFEEIYFWRNKIEVDCVFKKQNSLIPVEVKYQNLVKIKESKHFENIIYVTKDYFKVSENKIFIPASLFLSILKI